MKKAECKAFRPRQLQIDQICLELVQNVAINLKQCKTNKRQIDMKSLSTFCSPSLITEFSALRKPHSHSNKQIQAYLKITELYRWFGVVFWKKNSFTQRQGPRCLVGIIPRLRETSSE